MMSLTCDGGIRFDRPLQLATARERRYLVSTHSAIKLGSIAALDLSTNPCSSLVLQSGRGPILSRFVSCCPVMFNPVHSLPLPPGKEGC